MRTAAACRCPHETPTQKSLQEEISSGGESVIPHAVYHRVPRPHEAGTRPEARGSADQPLSVPDGGNGRQHLDNYMLVEHASPRCGSRQFYIGILDGHAHGVFHGRIIVHKDAQKTDAKQTHRNLLLSDDAYNASRAADLQRRKVMVGIWPRRPSISAQC